MPKHFLNSYIFKPILNLLPLTALMLLTACAGHKGKNDDIAMPEDTSAPTPVYPINTTYMPTGFYYLASGTAGIKMRMKGSDVVYAIEPRAFASVKNIVSAELEETPTRKDVYTSLCMKFDQKGTSNLKEGTGNPLHSKIAAVIANRLLFVVDNAVKIKTGVMCVSLIGYTEDEIKTMQNEVNHKK